MKPGLERIRGLLHLVADPHEGYPIVHVAGTNGKTSTVTMAAAILAAHGLTVGTFISPHLERIEERFALNGRAMTEAEFAQAMSDLVPFAELFEERSGDGVTYFELTAALAFAWFAERTVDAAVVEVGLGGRLDATNVVDAEVAVLTSVAVDHTDHLGERLSDIAGEKVAILGEGRVLVSGPLPEEAIEPVARRVADAEAQWRRFDEDFHVGDLTQAVGGWLCDVEGVYATYHDVFLPVHGRHQVTNLAVATAAVEELLGRSLDEEALRDGVGAVRCPGRLEVASRRPLVVLDGAHNVHGFTALASALGEEFLPSEWTLVFGARGRRDPEALLAPLAGRVGRVFATAPRADDAIPPGDAAAAAVSVFGPGVGVEEAASVPEALTRALAEAGDRSGVLVAGSLYVVGEARSILGDEGNRMASIAGRARMEG